MHHYFGSLWRRRQSVELENGLWSVLFTPQTRLDSTKKESVWFYVWQFRFSHLTRFYRVAIEANKRPKAVAPADLWPLESENQGRQTKKRNQNVVGWLATTPHLLSILNLQRPKLARPKTRPSSHFAHCPIQSVGIWVEARGKESKKDPIWVTNYSIKAHNESAAALEIEKKALCQESISQTDCGFDFSCGLVTGMNNSSLLQGHDWHTWELLCLLFVCPPLSLFLEW